MADVLAAYVARTLFVMQELSDEVDGCLSAAAYGVLREKDLESEKRRVEGLFESEPASNVLSQLTNKKGYFSGLLGHAAHHVWRAYEGFLELDPGRGDWRQEAEETLHENLLFPNGLEHSI